MPDQRSQARTTRQAEDELAQQAKRPARDRCRRSRPPHARFRQPEREPSVHDRSPSPGPPAPQSTADRRGGGLRRDAEPDLRRGPGRAGTPAPAHHLGTRRTGHHRRRRHSSLRGGPAAAGRRAAPPLPLCPAGHDRTPAQRCRVPPAQGPGFGGRAGRGVPWWAAGRQGRSVQRPAIAVVLLTLGVGLLGLLANRDDVDGILTVASALWEVARLAVGLPGPLGLDGWFGRLFPATIMAMFLVGAGLVVLRLLGPSLTRRRPDPDLPALAACSDESLAYFALRDDRNSVRAGDAVVSYGTVRTVALAAGDPLGPSEQWSDVVAAFLAEAARQGRVAAVMGCGAAAARTYEQAGLAAVYLGDEAVLDLDGFSLQGRAVRIARQSWHRAKRAGFTCQVWRADDLDSDTTAALRAVSRRWRGDAAERGFSMALGRLFDPRDRNTYVVAARDGTGRLRGFLHFVPWGGDGASLDVMRRDRQAPAILNDFLVVEATRRLPELGVRRISLNFSFLRGVLAAEAEPGAPLGLRLQRWALRRLSWRFQIETLYRFNKKFAPSWAPRYLAVEAIEDLPRVALGALRLEGLFAPPPRRDGRERTERDELAPDCDALPTPTS